MPLARFHFGIVKNGVYSRNKGPGLPDFDAALQAALLYVKHLRDVSIVAIECVREPELIGAFGSDAVTLNDFVRLTPEEAHLLMAGRLLVLPKREQQALTAEQLNEQLFGGTGAAPKEQPSPAVVMPKPVQEDQQKRSTSFIEFEAMWRDRHQYILAYAYNLYVEGKPLSHCIREAEEAAIFVFDDEKKQ